MKKLKQILAIICIVILVGLYVTTFILSILDSSATMAWFKGSIACTIFIPVAAYGFICLHRYAMTRSGRKDYYDTCPSSSGSDSDSVSDSK